MRMIVVFFLLIMAMSVQANGATSDAQHNRDLTQLQQLLEQMQSQLVTLQTELQTLRREVELAEPRQADLSPAPTVSPPFAAQPANSAMSSRFARSTIDLNRRTTIAPPRTVETTYGYTGPAPSYAVGTPAIDVGHGQVHRVHLRATRHAWSFGRYRGYGHRYWYHRPYWRYHHLRITYPLVLRIW